MAVNAELLALLDWVPCFGGPGCPALAAGQQRVIPWSTVYGYTSTSTKQYMVFWWHGLVLPDGTVRTDGGGNVTVTR